MATIKKRQSNYIQVSNSFLRDEKLSFKAKGLFCYMFSMAEGWNFTIRSIAKQQKDGEASVKSSLDELKELGYVTYTKHVDGSGTYYLDDEPNVENPNVENPNVENPNLGKSQRIKNKQSTKNNNCLEEQLVSNIVEIVEHLNQVCRTNYKHTSAKTKTLVKTRLKDGFTLEDFKKVHITKFAEWYGTDMQKYLRPETLYGTKFESYLNQTPTDYEKLNAITSHTGLTPLQFLKQQGFAE
ncbi:MAG: conserved phage C-terminal domain-containing protein [Candidatus Cloacimonas sp.]